ncbi:MAG: carbohydrate kinase family protein [Actinomycetota bacterium]
MRAVILGGVAWNTMVNVDRFPEPAPQTVFASGSHEAVGGSGAGKAMNLALLGADVTLWALIGDDEPGQRVRAELTDRRVEFVGEIDPLGTSRHVNLMDNAGDRISIFANAGSLEAEIDPSPMIGHIKHADLVSLTIHQHCAAFIPIVKAAEKDLWVDIHDYDGENPYHVPFYEAADYLFMSTAGTDDCRGFLEERIAAGTKAAVCTHGAGGASGITAEDGWIHVSAMPVDKVVDTNGAGDALFSGFTVKWLEGGGLAASLHAGAALAARAVQVNGLAPI